MKAKVLNFYGGPGTGKSSIATAVYAECKMRGNTPEYVDEFAKSATYERRGKKVFEAQEFLFGHQHFKMVCLSHEVDFLITDSPILMSDVYTPDEYHLPSLKKVFREAYDSYDNIDIFLVRNKPFEPRGRNQTEPEAKTLDKKIRRLLTTEQVNSRIKNCYEIDYGREVIPFVMDILESKGWIKPLTNEMLEELYGYHMAMAKKYKTRYLQEVEIARSEAEKAARARERQQQEWLVIEEEKAAARSRIVESLKPAAVKVTAASESSKQIYPFKGLRKNDSKQLLIDRLKEIDIKKQDRIVRVGVANKWGTLKYVYVDESALTDQSVDSWFKVIQLGRRSQAVEIDANSGLEDLLYHLGCNHSPSKVFIEILINQPDVVLAGELQRHG